MQNHPAFERAWNTGRRLVAFVREPLRAHPCALVSGRPWPPTFPDKSYQPPASSGTPAL